MFAVLGRPVLALFAVASPPIVAAGPALAPAFVTSVKGCRWPGGLRHPEARRVGVRGDDSLAQGFARVPGEASPLRPNVLLDRAELREDLSVCEAVASLSILQDVRLGSGQVLQQRVQGREELRYAVKARQRHGEEDAP